jgi:hypothetical protein
MYIYIWIFILRLFSHGLLILIPLVTSWAHGGADLVFDISETVNLAWRFELVQIVVRDDADARPHVTSMLDEMLDKLLEQ